MTYVASVILGEALGHTRRWFAVTALVGLALGCAARAQAAPFAYVTNGGDNTVSQYLIGSGGLLAATTPSAVSAGFFPSAVAVSPDGRSVYVANEFGNTVSQFSVGSDGTLSAKTPAAVPTGNEAGGVVVNPDGHSLYVTNPVDNTVSQYSVGSDGTLSAKTPATVPTGAFPTGVAVSSDGQNVYVINQDDNTVSQFLVGSGGALSAKTPAAVPTDSFPTAVAVSPDDHSVYVTNFVGSDFGDTVSQYSVGSDGGLTAKTPATILTGNLPNGVVVSPDGHSVYVTDSFDNTVSQYSVDVGGRLLAKTPATVATGGHPIGVAVSPDGRSVYITNQFDNTLSQYSVSSSGMLSAKTPATVPTGGFPTGVAVSPVRGADLSITKSGSPNRLFKRQRLTYTISATNNGPQPATGVTITDALPARVRFQSMFTTQGMCTRASTTRSRKSGGTVTCSLGGLANGASATVTIVVKATRPGILTNTAGVHGNEVDPMSADNRSTATNIVLGGKSRHGFASFS